MPGAVRRERITGEVCGAGEPATGLSAGCRDVARRYWATGLYTQSGGAGRWGLPCGGRIGPFWRYAGRGSRPGRPGTQRAVVGLWLGSDWVVVDGRGGGDRVGTDSGQAGRVEWVCSGWDLRSRAGAKLVRLGAGGVQHGPVRLGAVWCCPVLPSAPTGCGRRCGACGWVAARHLVGLYRVDTACAVSGEAWRDLSGPGAVVERRYMQATGRHRV